MFGLIPFLNLKRKQKKELLLFFTNFEHTMSRRYFSEVPPKILGIEQIHLLILYLQHLSEAF
jgi:hypothetical protein